MRCTTIDRSVGTVVVSLLHVYVYNDEPNQNTACTSSPAQHRNHNSIYKYKHGRTRIPNRNHMMVRCTSATNDGHMHKLVLYHRHSGVMQGMPL